MKGIAAGNHAAGWATPSPGWWALGQASVGSVAFARECGKSSALNGCASISTVALVVAPGVPLTGALSWTVSDFSAAIVGLLSNEIVIALAEVSPSFQFSVPFAAT